MSNKNHIPKSEKQLAQEVGTFLEDDRSILSINDPLIDLIVKQKSNLYTTFENEIEESKSNSWNKIAGVIREGESENHTSKTGNNSTSPIKRWQPYVLKIAAAFLVVVMLSLVYLQMDFNQPEILVKAESTKITHTLNDQSVVQLRPNSSLSILEQTDRLVRYKLVGEAFFDVTRDENRRFMVEAGNGIIEVIGTSFNIREWVGETVVYLQEGSLILNSAGNTDKVRLKPGEVAKVNSDSEVSEVVQSNGEDFTAWQRDEIILDNRTVGSVIKELEYHYSIDIRIPNSVEPVVLGGKLSLDSSDLSIENLGVVLGGKFSSIDDDTYQFFE